jgi:hypothetical protein
MGSNDSRMMAMMAAQMQSTLYASFSLSRRIYALAFRRQLGEEEAEP